MASVSFETPFELPRPGSLAIFRVAGPKVSERTVLATARRLGMPGNKIEVTSNDLSMSCREGSNVLTMHRQSGAGRFIDVARWERDDGRTDIRIPDREAENAARRFIGRSRIVPLKECRFLKVSRLHVGTMALKSQEAEERTISLGVIFRRLIKGVPADGPGGRVIVHLDQQGEVSGADWIWRPLRGSPQPVRELRSVDEVLGELNGFAERFGDANVRVYERRFGYFELGHRDKQTVIQPAHVFLMKVWGPSERVHRKSVFVAPAGTNGPGPLTPRAKPPRKQPPRPHVPVKRREQAARKISDPGAQLNAGAEVA